MRPEARIVFLEPVFGTMQEKDVVRRHVPHCEHCDRGDRDSEVWISHRSLVAVRMELSDHHSAFYGEALQTLIHRIQAPAALGVHAWHDHQSAVEQYSGIARGAPGRSEFTDLGSQLVDQL